MKNILLSLLVLFSVSAIGQISVTTINKKKNKPNEPTIAISPLNPNFLVAGANTNFVYYTTNAGKKWKEFKATSEFGVYGDPVFHFTDSSLFFTHLSKTKGKKYGDWFDRIVVQRVDEIKKWEEESYSVGFNEPKMQDKPWLNHYGEDVYITWTEFDKYDSKDPKDRSRIQFSAYSKKTNSWSEAITISDGTGDCVDSDSTLEGATTATGPNGEIYCVWAGFDKIYFDKSLDGGKTWGEDQIISTQIEGWDMAMPNIMRANGLPFLTIDKKRNILYATWAGEQDGNADIWVVYSIDGGESWSKKVKMNTDSTDSHQYFPNLAVDEKTGKLYVAYYDQRNSSLCAFYDIYLSEFQIGGELNNYRISPKSIPLPGKSYFYGDYLDIDIQNNALAIVYATFNLNDKANIEVAYTPDISNLKTELTSESQLASLLNGNQLQLVMNVQHKYSVKGWVKSGLVNREKKEFNINYNNEDTDLEEVIAEYDVAGFVTLKYKITNLETGEKKKYKGTLISF